MNRPTILISLIAFILIALPSHAAQAGQALPARWSDCVAVLASQRDDTRDSSGDDIGGMLSAMNVSYRAITPADLQNDAFLIKLCALFIASGNTVSPPAAPHLARWVERGGALYVSGSALDVLLDAFPGHITSSGQAAPGTFQIQVTDAGLAAAIGPGVSIQAAESWPLLAKGKLDLDRGRL